MSIEIRPLTALVGAEVLGVDLREPSSAEMVVEVESALLSHLVVFCRRQERFSDESKRKILWENAVDFYRFPESHMPSTFEEASS